MNIKSVFDKDFIPYGKVLEGYDFAPMVAALTANTPKPSNSVVYVPGEASLEKLEVSKELQNNYYGGMPIQVGYCNGHNLKLNCLEYHRDSEVNIAADDIVLLVAKQQDITDGKLDTSAVEGFLLPKGHACELYATTLHYAPCTAPEGDGFRVAVVLPKGTNTAKPEIAVKNFEDGLLRACNKWLIAHRDASEASQGAYVGLTGENIELKY